MNSEVNASTNAFTKMETFVISLRMRNQAPISLAWTISGLLNWDTKLKASARMRMAELRRAKRGPSGKAATNMVANPYCKTITKEQNNMNTLINDLHKVYGRVIYYKLTDYINIWYISFWSTLSCISLRYACGVQCKCYVKSRHSRTVEPRLTITPFTRQSLYCDHIISTQT